MNPRPITIQNKGIIIDKLSKSSANLKQYLPWINIATSLLDIF